MHWVPFSGGELARVVVKCHPTTNTCARPALGAALGVAGGRLLTDGDHADGGSGYDHEVNHDGGQAGGDDAADCGCRSRSVNVHTIYVHSRVGHESKD